MMKVMLSQPMAGKTEEEIIATRERAIAVLKERGYEIINTLFTDEWYSKESMKERGVENIPLCFLTFQSTPLMRGETMPNIQTPDKAFYFNPLPSCEGRPYICIK